MDEVVTRPMIVPIDRFELLSVNMQLIVSNRFRFFVPMILNRIERNELKSELNIWTVD